MYIRTVVMKIVYNVRLFVSVSIIAEVIKTAKKYIVINAVKTITRGVSICAVKPFMYFIIALALSDLTMPCLCVPFFGS